MNQAIFNSVRKLNFYNFKTKYINQNESVGELLKKQWVEDFGSIPEPSCLDYNADISLMAIGSKKGLIKIFGYPGICYTARLDGQIEIWNIKFISDTNYLVTLTSENRLILWLMCSSSNELVKVDTISNLNLLSMKHSMKFSQPDNNNNNINNNEYQLEQNITAIEIIDFTSSVIMGNGEGSIIQVKLDLLKMRKQCDSSYVKPIIAPGNSVWQIPTKSDVIDSERIISKLPIGSQSRVVLNTVIHISPRPGSRKHLLIGYRSGCSIVYDLQKDSVVYLLSTRVPLNDLCWFPPDPIIQDSLFVTPGKTQIQYQLSTGIYSCHEDGSIIMWNVNLGDDAILAFDSNPFFPHGNNQKCLPISKIMCKTYPRGNLLIFDGGLPRSEHMTKSTITIMSDKYLHSPNTKCELQHVVLDLTSQLIDFQTIHEEENGYVQYILVLTEEEFFIVDLTKDDWPVLYNQQPYLKCLHHSPITAYRFFSKVSAEWFHKLTEIVGFDQKNNGYCKDWPINGHAQRIRDNDVQLVDIWQNDLLIIGHGDGTIAFWRLGLGGCMERVAIVKSSNLFKIVDEAQLTYKDYEDEVIPFKRTGVFDPCCDDNRLAIQLIHYTGNNLLIGGCGGQVILWGYDNKSCEKQVVEVDLTTHLPNFKWKGCQPLQHVDNTPKSESALQPMVLLSIFPPSQITALDILNDKADDKHLLIACGTLHGLVMIACAKHNDSEPVILTTHCSVPRNSLASQEAALGEGWARRRTRELKKSLRSSFRRLRRRSTKRMEHPSVNRINLDNKTMKVEYVENEVEFEERAIEDRPKDTANDGLIRTIKIQLCVMKRKVSNIPSDTVLNLFAGTSGGQILWFQSDNINENFSVNNLIRLKLFKQYQFQHRAPVLYFNILYSDSQSGAVPKSNENEHESLLNKKADQILVITEEQVRLYSFPSFALKSKVRVTACDGFRLKNAHIGILNDEQLGNGHKNLNETLICITNNGGQFLFLNSTNLRRKDAVQFVDKTDLMALNFMSMASTYFLSHIQSVFLYGIHYSGQGQITLFEVIPKVRNIGTHSKNYNFYKSMKC